MPDEGARDGNGETGNEWGILLRGYTREQADAIREFLEALAGRRITPISATGLEGRIVGDILDSAPYSDFGAAEPRMLMFLGFDDDHIGAAMQNFPAGIPRPIFCAPTMRNLDWTLEYLIEHLEEERRSLRG